MRDPPIERRTFLTALGVATTGATVESAALDSLGGSRLVDDATEWWTQSGGGAGNTARLETAPHLGIGDAETNWTTKADDDLRRVPLGVREGRLLVALVGREPRTPQQLHGFDAATGERVWTHDGLGTALVWGDNDDLAAYEMGLVTTLGPEKAYFLERNGDYFGPSAEFVAVNAETGTEDWRTEIDAVVHNVSYADGRVSLVLGDGQYRDPSAIRQFASDGTTAWSNDRLKPFQTAEGDADTVGSRRPPGFTEESVVYPWRRYVDEGRWQLHATAVDPESGESVWSTELATADELAFETVSGMSDPLHRFGSVMVTPERLFVPYSVSVYPTYSLLLALDHGGRVQWKIEDFRKEDFWYENNAPLSAGFTFALTETAVVFCGKEAIHACSRESGDSQWRVDLDEFRFSPSGNQKPTRMFTLDGVVYVNFADARLYGFDAETGEVVFVQLPGGNSGTPTPGRDSIYYAVDGTDLRSAAEPRLRPSIEDDAYAGLEVPVSVALRNRTGKTRTDVSLSASIPEADDVSVTAVRDVPSEIPAGGAPTATVVVEAAPSVDREATVEFTLGDAGSRRSSLTVTPPVSVTPDRSPSGAVESGTSVGLRLDTEVANGRQFPFVGVSPRLSKLSGTWKRPPEEEPGSLKPGLGSWIEGPTGDDPFWQLADAAAGFRSEPAIDVLVGEDVPTGQYEIPVEAYVKATGDGDWQLVDRVGLATEVTEQYLSVFVSEPTDLLDAGERRTFAVEVDSQDRAVADPVVEVESVAQATFQTTSDSVRVVDGSAAGGSFSLDGGIGRWEWPGEVAPDETATGTITVETPSGEDPGGRFELGASATASVPSVGETATDAERFQLGVSGLDGFISNKRGVARRIDRLPKTSIDDFGIVDPVLDRIDQQADGELSVETAQSFVDRLVLGELRVEEAAKVMGPPPEDSNRTRTPVQNLAYETAEAAASAIGNIAFNLLAGAGVIAARAKNLKGVVGKTLARMIDTVSARAAKTVDGLVDDIVPGDVVPTVDNVLDEMKPTGEDIATARTISETDDIVSGFVGRLTDALYDHYLDFYQTGPDGLAGQLRRFVEQLDPASVSEPAGTKAGASGASRAGGGKTIRIADQAGVTLREFNDSVSDTVVELAESFTQLLEQPISEAADTLREMADLVMTLSTGALFSAVFGRTAIVELLEANGRMLDGVAAGRNTFDA